MSSNFTLKTIKISWSWKGCLTSCRPGPGLCRHVPASDVQEPDIQVSRWLHSHSCRGTLRAVIHLGLQECSKPQWEHSCSSSRAEWASASTPNSVPAEVIYTKSFLRLFCWIWNSNGILTVICSSTFFSFPSWFSQQPLSLVRWQTDWSELQEWTCRSKFPLWPLTNPNGGTF